MSMTAAGVPYSRAILAARGVVIARCSRLSLLYLFTQNFKFQPFVFGGIEFLLRFCKRIRGLIEFPAILLVEIWIVKVPLLFGDLGLQFGDCLRQGFQRVLFVEI